MRVTKSFTIAEDGPDILVSQGATVEFSLTGTFAGTLVLEQFEGGGWRPLNTVLGPVSGTIVVVADPGETHARLRWRAAQMSSGTAVTVLTATAMQIDGVVFPLVASLLGINPADLLNQYFAAGINVNNPTFAAAPRIWVPARGTIRAIYMSVWVGGTIGSGEPAQVNLRINDSTVIPLFSDLVHNSAGRTQQLIATELGIPVRGGDFLTMHIVYPTFVTNPTFCSYDATIVVEKAAFA